MTKPDWRKAEDYKHISLETIGGQGVAWEFLRRNENFILDVQNYNAGNVDEILNEWGKAAVRTQNDVLLHSKSKKVFFSPPLLDNESERAWINRCLDLQIEPRVSSPGQCVINKWSLNNQIFDPELNASELNSKTVFSTEKSPHILKSWDDVLKLRTYNPDHLGNDCPTQLSQESVVVVFSLNESTSKQWKRISTTISKLHDDHKEKAELPGTASSKKNVWISALRAWDANIVDPTIPKIKRANIIYKDSGSDLSKTYDDHLKTATRLINGDYLSIVHR